MASAWLAPTLTLGARSFVSDETGPEGPTHLALLFAPGLLAGLVLGHERDNHVQVEVGVLVPLAGASRFVEYTASVPMRLGPGDVRFEVRDRLRVCLRRESLDRSRPKPPPPALRTV